MDLTGLAGQALNVVIAGELESPEPDFAVYLSSADTNVLTALSEVTITTVEDLNALGIQVFPNPIRDILQIQSDGNIRAVEILSIHGKSILVEDNISTHWSKSLDHLVAGDYIIVIRTNEATFGLPLVKL